MNVSAAWTSVTEDYYYTDGGGTHIGFTATYDRKPGIYLNSFTLNIKGTIQRDMLGNYGAYVPGIWSIPYNVAPHYSTTAEAGSNNSTHLLIYPNVAIGTSKTIDRKITTQECFTGSGGIRTTVPNVINDGVKYWYRVYPGDGSVTASMASGTVHSGNTVTFTTPTKCTWPTYYNGTSAANHMEVGKLWPDILITYSGSGWPDDPEYDNTGSSNIYSGGQRFSYNSGTQTTTASLTLRSGSTYYVKVRLAVDNDGSGSDVEYGKVNTSVYYGNAAPTASPGTGTYTGMQSVRLSGSGGSIRYTTDGSNPSASSSVYSSALSFNRTTTLKAQLYSGMTPISPVATYTYTINYSALTAAPAAGTYTGAQNIALGNGDGMDIRYTADGTEPTASSPLYTGAIPIDSSCTIKARRYIGTTAYGSTTSFPYTINYAPASASPAAGTYPHTQTVTLAPGVLGGELYYTLDGSAPSKENGTKYEQPIQITENTKIRVQQYQGDAARGGVADFDYVIQLPGIKADPAAGMILKGSDVTLSLAASDAQHTDIFYTLDVNQPREKWTAANFPIRVDEACTIYAVAQDKASKRYGEVCEFAYTVTDTGYILNSLAFYQGSAKVESSDIAALAGKTVTAKANIIKIIPSVQGWLVTALYDPSGRAEAIKLDKLDQISGASRGDAVGKPISLPANTTGYMLKTFIVHDFAHLRPVGAAVRIGEKVK